MSNNEAVPKLLDWDWPEDGEYPGGWFGASWGAPVCEDISHKPTPVGEECLYLCGTPIGDGDQGLVMPHFYEQGRFRLAATHLRCFRRHIGPGRGGSLT